MYGETLLYEILIDMEPHARDNKPPRNKNRIITIQLSNTTTRKIPNLKHRLLYFNIRTINYQI